MAFRKNGSKAFLGTGVEVTINARLWDPYVTTYVYQVILPNQVYIEVAPENLFDYNPQLSADISDSVKRLLRKRANS